MRIVVIGTGYVGLVTGACLAGLGFDVTCVDNDKAKIGKLKEGLVPFYEPGLEQLVTENTKAGRLKFADSQSGITDKANVVFLAVGTPKRQKDNEADLSYLYEAAKETAKNLSQNHFTVVVVKSTVPFGTNRKVESMIKKEAPEADFEVCSNPEFLREGSAIKDFMQPDRVAVGTRSERGKAVMEAIYKPLSSKGAKIMYMSPEDAEIVKCLSNAFLATKIAFINEAANLCEKVGANIMNVAKGIGADSRIGAQFLNPGPGYGGSCFPKDTLAIASSSRKAGAPLRVTEAVIKSNLERKDTMVSRIIDACGGSVRNKTIAVLGVAFKGNTDDLREAVSLTVIPKLQSKKATVRAFDPAAMENAKAVLQGVNWCNDAYEAATGADAIVILTEWDEFRHLDLKRLHALMRENVIIDLRNLYDPETVAASGFDYYSIGRAKATKR